MTGIAIMIATLNGLDIWMTDIGNAYLMGHWQCIFDGTNYGRVLCHCWQWVWIQSHGPNTTIVWALYGLKSTGATFWLQLATILHVSLHFLAYQADPPDVCMHWAFRPMEHHNSKYILVYIDNIMTILVHPDRIIKAFHNHFMLKVVSNSGIELDC
jgi:hypothetical protein